MQLTIPEAARLLRVSASTVHRWIQDRDLPAVRFNEQYRLNEVDLLVWAQMNQVAVDPDELAAQREPPPPLSAALRLGGIHRDVPGGTPKETILAAVERLPVPDAGDRAMLAQMIGARERLGSTAIGNGIALPHARFPVVLPLGEPMLALCFLQQPVDFGASDGQGVHTLFAVVTPTIRVHLQFLARLARALQGGFGRAVRERAPDGEILAALRESERAAADAAGPDGPRR